jgi:hypothetical protein
MWRLSSPTKSWMREGRKGVPHMRLLASPDGVRKMDPGPFGSIDFDV